MLRVLLPPTDARCGEHDIACRGGQSSANSGPAANCGPNCGGTCTRRNPSTSQAGTHSHSHSHHFSHRDADSDCLNCRGPGPHRPLAEPVRFPGVPSIKGRRVPLLRLHSFGNQVGQGTAIQEEEFLYISGEGFLFDGFGNPYYIAYTGEMTLDGNVLEGDLYDAFGTYLGSVLFTRDSSRFGQ